MQACRFLVLASALWACGGRTADDASLNGVATGGSPGTTGTGGAMGFPIDACPAVEFQVVSTPGYDAEWCVGSPRSEENVFDVADDFGSLILVERPLRCQVDDCDASHPEFPWAMPPEYVIEGSLVTWTGIYHTVSACGASASTCSVPHCARVGVYVATVCGYVNPNPEWIDGCSEANDQTAVFCGASEFEYPPEAPIVVTLRPPIE